MARGKVEESAGMEVAASAGPAETVKAAERVMDGVWQQGRSCKSIGRALGALNVGAESGKRLQRLRRRRSGSDGQWGGSAERHGESGKSVG